MLDYEQRIREAGKQKPDLSKTIIKDPDEDEFININTGKPVIMQDIDPE